MPVVPPIMTARLSSAESSTTDPGIETVLESRRVNKRHDRRAGRASRLQRAIVLVVLEIAAADEREDAAGLVIERDDRALKIIRRRQRSALARLLRAS